MLMNKDLFPSARDAEIADMRRLIAKFKAYDKERTAQYKALLKENAWLKEELNELSDHEKLTKRAIEQRKTIVHLKNVIEANNFKKDFPDEFIDSVKLYKEKCALQRNNAKLQARIKNMSDEISELVYKIAQNENKSTD